MRFSSSIATVTFIMIMIASGVAVSGDANPIKGPAVFVGDRDFVFSQVLEGRRVDHDFIIGNRGDRDLKINKVKTG